MDIFISWLIGYRALVRVFLCRKDFGSAYPLIDHMLLLIGGQPLECHRLLVESLRVEAFLSQQKLADALNLATSLGVLLDDEIVPLPSFWDEIACLKSLIKIRVLIGAGQYDLALQFIPSLLKYLKSFEQNYFYMELLLLYVISKWSAKNELDCLDSMLELVHLLAPHSTYSMIVRDGQSAQLLKKLVLMPKVRQDVVADDYIK